jgi:hypothetical protein
VVTENLIWHQATAEGLIGAVEDREIDREIDTWIFKAVACLTSERRSSESFAIDGCAPRSAGFALQL